METENVIFVEHCLGEDEGHEIVVTERIAEECGVRAKGDTCPCCGRRLVYGKERR